MARNGQAAVRRRRAMAPSPPRPLTSNQAVAGSGTGVFASFTSSPMGAAVDEPKTCALVAAIAYPRAGTVPVPVVASCGASSWLAVPVEVCCMATQYSPPVLGVQLTAVEFQPLPVNVAVALVTKRAPLRLAAELPMKFTPSLLLE